MTLPRSSLISLSDTPYYHCVSRCVRRAFLCGVDHYSGKSYEHRRAWLEQKLLSTASIFGIKLCAYAVMSNHYHVVLHVRPDLIASWSDKEVVSRWHRLFKGSLLSQRYTAGEPLLEAEWRSLQEDIDKWRERLMSVSWFMRIVNEAIARQANQEDQCTGSFWESRFKSQALLDERALLSCMAYVDLNPIRAKMAQTTETSKYTSVAKRIRLMQKNKPEPEPLERFVGIRQATKIEDDATNIGIPFKQKDYLDLIDWTGRIIRDDKRGVITADIPPILERLSLDKTAWARLTTEFEERFQNWVGAEHIVRKVCSDHSYKRFPSTASHRALFPT